MGKEGKISKGIFGNKGSTNVEKEFTARAILWGIVIGIILLCLLAYMLIVVGISIGVSPISALLGLVLLPIIGGKATKLELNIVQTIASAVATTCVSLVVPIAAAIIFGYEFNWMIFFPLLIASQFIGIVLITILRKQMLEDPCLKFPGALMCKTVVEKVEDPPKAELRLMLIFTAIGLIFGILQTRVGIIPASIDFTKYLPSGMIINIAVMPMLMGIGYIVGFKVGIMILIGTLVTNLILAPIGTALQWYPNPQEGIGAMQNFNLSLMIGITMAAGIIPLIRNRQVLKNSLKIKGVSL